MPREVRMRKSAPRRKASSTSAAGTTTTTAAVKGLNETEYTTTKEETEHTPVYIEGEPAYVKVAAGVTKGLGRQYEFVRVDVAINMPCYPDEVEAVAEELGNRVYEILNKEVENYLG